MKVIASPAFKSRADNPYTWLLYSNLSAAGVDVSEFSPARLVSGHHDIWHLHWPEHLLSTPSRAVSLAKIEALRLLLAIARRRGTKIVWTAHNLQSHERLHPLIESHFRRWFIPMVDGLITLTEDGADAAYERYPRLERIPVRIIPHGHYMDVYPNHVPASEARHRLGISDRSRILLFFGHIRPYKNVPLLIQSFIDGCDQNTRLIIAGKPANSAIESSIRSLGERDPRVFLCLRHLSEDEAQLFFNAADLVALPFVEILNSGSAILALSFGKPLLVPDAPSMRDLRSRFGDQVVITFPGSLTGAVLKEALSHVLEAPAQSDLLMSAVRRELGWDVIARETHAYYYDLVQRGSPILRAESP